MEIIITLFAFVMGLLIGSFVNVLIYRIPKKEDFISKPSHCMNCGKRIKPYDLVPLFSYIFLRGKCRYCKTKLSLQYPLVELINGVAYCAFFAVFMNTPVQACLYCLLFSALLAISVIDFRTFEIPFGLNVFIFILGLVRVGFYYTEWYNYLIGFVCVSGVLAILFYVSKGKAIGGGDVKLMAACGLLLGWKLIIFAFLAGCIYAAIIHPLRMKFSKQGRVLAMGPYLAAGVITAVFAAEPFINWYLSLLV